MPNYSYDADYRRWLAGHVGSDVQAINTIHIYGQPIGNNYFASIAEESLSATIETGQTVDFLGTQFVLALPRVELGTNQVMEISMPGVDGQVYRRIKNIQVSARSLPIYITFRVFLSNDLSKPMVDPPPTLQLRRVSAGRDAVLLEASPPQWANRQAGRYYNVESYPGLFNV